MGEKTDYVKSLNTIVAHAKKELKTFLYSVDGSDPVAIRDALLVVYPALCDKYGNMAAVVAAEHYEEERKKVYEEDFDAIVGDTVATEITEADVRYAAGHLFEG